MGLDGNETEDPKTVHTDGGVITTRLNERRLSFLILKVGSEKYGCKYQTGNRMKNKINSSREGGRSNH